MGEVNLHELALKSIEQYATLGVRLASLEQALIESNRRAEASQDKFIAACDKLSRMEEKMLVFTEDRALMHRRIDDTRNEVDKLVVLVRDLTKAVKDHKDNHCSNCGNESRIEALEGLVENLRSDLTTHSKGTQELNEVRRKITSPQGLLFMRFITSKWGLGWFAAANILLALSFVFHRDKIQAFYDLFRVT